MNERDLKLTCEEIKLFRLLIQWQMVEIGQCYSVAFGTYNQSIRGNQFCSKICVEADKTAKILLQHILYLLDTFQCNCSKTKQNFCTTGICYEEEGLVAVLRFDKKGKMFL